MKYKLHARLAKLLGMHTETRPRIIEALWQYVKTHRLQDSQERDYINCDKYLEQVSHLHFTLADRPNHFHSDIRRTQTVAFHGSATTAPVVAPAT
jgi:SWI/SNF-related matrix-associated actin-dependent regulator of chromatin subfamily D